MTRHTRELLKIQVVAVTVERDAAGKIVGEVQGTPLFCYSADELSAYFHACGKEIEAWNAEQNPNRATRRSRARRAPKQGGKK